MAMAMTIPPPIDRELYSFQNWKAQLVYNNDTDAQDSSYLHSQQYLLDKLTSLHEALQQINANYDATTHNGDIAFINQQLAQLVDYLFTTYEKSKEIKILSVNINNLLAKTLTFNLNIMMKNGHEKFNISLIELTNKLVDTLTANVKKLSMSKNWYSSLKHLCVIILQHVFTKFNGFLNNSKNILVTALYKHLAKANDSYNSSIDSGDFKSNFFTDTIHLIDIILTHDRSNNVLDDKLFTRLFKLFKFVTQRNSTASLTSTASSKTVSNLSSKVVASQSSTFTYPLVSIIHSFSILVSLLKSDKYIASISSGKKTTLTPAKYLSSLKEYSDEMFATMDTDHKKLKLCLTKNLSDILVYTYVVFGYNTNDTDNALEVCLGLLLNEYRAGRTSSNLKSSIIETIIQFISKLNLYYQTDRVKSSKTTKSTNFVSMKFFDIMDIIYSRLFEFPNTGSNKLKFKSDDLNHIILINNSISMNYAIKTLNHLSLIHGFMMKELDNDINKLIVLSKLILGSSKNEEKIKFKCLEDIIVPGKEDISNVWYVCNLLSFAQLLIDNLNEFILSDHGNLATADVNANIVSQLIKKISCLCTNRNFRLRVTAVETLIKIIKVKPEVSFEILNKLMETLATALKKKETQENNFNENYASSYLISSIISFSSKEYITSDFILKTFSLSLDMLKKFNTSVMSSNLFGSNNGLHISNIDYERQIVSWILLLGLFNYASNDEIKSNNVFLQDSNQFLVIWKNLLAHSLPKDFLQVDSKTKIITNVGEVMKIIEIKNQSLVCLISYINYLQSISSLDNEDVIRQINQILTKTYTFVTMLSNEISSLNTPEFLTNSISGNKLRIFEAYLKLLPHINARNEISSTMLIEIVKNFADVEKFRYQFKDPYGKYIKTSKKRILVNRVSEYTLYYIDDGIWYGLTSKFNNFKVDELMIKNKVQRIVNSRSESDIDFVPSHTQLLIESPYLQSNFSNISIFDDTTENRNFNFLNHSLLHDSFMNLYNNSYNSGYTDTMRYPVPTDTMTIDTSIELFALSFPHLTSQIQLSILESIRSFLFYQSKESKVDTKKSYDESDEQNIKMEFSLTLRKKAIAINASIAFHSLLNYMVKYNCEHKETLRFKRQVSDIIIETLRNISHEDVYLVSLNSESIGICCSLVEDKEIQEEVLHHQVTVFINAIAETTSAYTRAFYIKSLAQLTKHSNLINTSRITDVLFTLVMDPHPVVHAATLQALDTFMNGNSSLEVSNEFADRILNCLQQIWLSDSYGISSNTTIVSNANFREHSNSVSMMIKLIRSLVNKTGPMIKLWDEDMKKKLVNLLFNSQHLVTIDFEIIVRELLKIYEEIMVFDKTLLNLRSYKMLTKLLIINNFKIGVYGHSLSNLPFDDEYDNESTTECFPCTTSYKLLNLSLESAFQLFKLEDDDIIDKDYEKLLWIALENDPDNQSIQNIVKIMMDDSMDRGTEDIYAWFGKLIGYFDITKTSLLQPLITTFEKRINNAGMYFHAPTKQSIPASYKAKKKSIVPSGKPEFNAGKEMGELDDFNEAEETLTSEEPTSKDFENSGVNKKASNYEDDDEDNYNAAIDATNDDSLYILDLSNEEINWKFKLFVLKMLNSLLEYCDHDTQLKTLLSKKITELVRISFISSTSNLITLRIASLKLLGKIIDLYSNLKDPLYPDVSILDQQQAQIMSTITPSFNKESNVELAGEGIVLSSKFISSNITNIKKAGRIIKILTSSLEDLASTTKDKGTNSSAISSDSLRIGDIPILTNKSENRIKIYVLQAWSRMLVLSDLNNNNNEELANLIHNYIKVLISLWVYYLREFTMLKYADTETLELDSTNEGLSLKIYEGCWIDFVESICIVIDNKEYYEYLVEMLGDDIGKLFMTIFGLSLEYLTKKSNKSSLGYSTDDARILRALKKLFKLDLSIQILFNDYIFTEFVDIVDRLILIASDVRDIEILSSVNELLRDIFLRYFDDLTLKSVDKAETKKSADEIYADFDKLFELLRLTIKIVSNKLPFIKNKEVLDADRNITVDGADFIIIKKCFSSFIEMLTLLPAPIQLDLYSSLIYMLILIHEFHNVQLSSILLPIFQKTLSNYKNLVSEDSENETNINNIYKTLKLSVDAKEDQLLAFIILKTVPDINISAGDVKNLKDMIIKGLTSSDSNLVSISTQTIKSIIDNQKSTKSDNSAKILSELIPALISIISDTDLSIGEPRLIIEIFVLLIKEKVDEETDESSIQAGYELVLPILVYFHNRFGFEDYIPSKLVELIELNPTSFKSVIATSNEELRNEIQKLVSVNLDQHLDRDGDEVEEQSVAHIELKTFG